jgi:hypothetical protein
MGITCDQCHGQGRDPEYVFESDVSQAGR